MNQKLAVLIVEDHPLISNAYKKTLKKISVENDELEFDISTAKNCDEADKQILIAKENDGLDIVFLDINIPPSKDKKLLSGEDLGIKIRKIIPDAKIMVSTSYFDNLRIQNIVKSIDPDGFLIKNDFNANELKLAIKTVINDPPYYSSTVLTSFRKNFSHIHVVDEIDRQLLFELSIGTKMKELPNIIPLSMAGIERRKRHLKEIFDLKDKDDRDLILIAKEKGFI